MDYQSAVWNIMESDEYKKVWDKVCCDFSFSPSIDKNAVPFKFEIPVDIYDISASPIWQDNIFLLQRIFHGVISHTHG